jgi:hypothetical protein
MRMIALFSSSTASACVAQSPGDPGAALLFANGHDGLSSREQVTIFQSLGLVVDSTGKGFLDTMCGQPAGATVAFSDWNHDGKTEVLILFGNSCTSGMAGSSAVLLIRSPKGGYSTNLGFPAGAVDTLPTRNLGYPDLLIGGPGFCFPVWRWNGREYDYLRQEPQSPDGCDHMNE